MSGDIMYFENIMSGLKIRDFAALRTSCIIAIIVWS